MPINEVLIAAQLISTIAGKVRENLENDGAVPEEGLPSLNDLAKGINELVKEGLLEFNNIDLDAPDSVREALLGRVTDSVKSFQRKFEFLEEDGILAKKTLKFLNQLCCPGTSGTKPTEKISDGATKVSPKKDSNKTPRLRYFIESLPQIPDHEEIIGEAWDVWAGLINISIERTLEKNKANVIIKEEDLPGNTIARASFGPPADSLMFVRFDKRDDWDSRSLQYSALHEFGHILGLDDTQQEGNIMYFRHQPNFFALGSEDVRLIVGTWGKSLG